MSIQSASSSVVVTGVQVYTAANSSQYHLSSHQPDWSTSCSPLMFVMTNKRSHVYVISGGCCSLQPKDQPVTKQVSSTAQSVQIELISEEIVPSCGISVPLFCSCCKSL